MILGAVLAGGQSRRFGEDKALAQLQGETLLELALRSLERCCDAVVVIGRGEGRSSDAVTALPDWPRPDMGPLGGIAAGLRHARAHGYTSLLTTGVDSVGLPDNLAQQLRAPPVCLASQPIIGHWPAEERVIAKVSAILEGDGKHSLRAFAESIEARRVRFAEEPANINHPADLAQWERRHAL